MKAFADDLRFAQGAGLAVRVRTMSGEEFLAGVHEVRDDEGYVSLYAPEHHGDDQTRRKLDYDLIESLTVTDIQWSASDEPRG
jgi:hypothetical protein